jgi:hypothetical protein
MNKSPGMRKWLTRCAVTVALIGIVLLAVLHQLHEPTISVGRALPPGKVKPQLFSGEDEALLLAPDGSLWAWRAVQINSRAVQINGSSPLPQAATSLDPRRIGTERDWPAVGAVNENSFTLRSNGTVWGRGIGISNDLAPHQIESDTNWVAISSDDYGLMAVKADGTLWVHNPNAYLIAPAFVSGLSTNFIRIGKDSDWAEVYVGYLSFFARKRDGSWWVCGQNVAGQLGLGISMAEVPSPRRLPFCFEPWAFASGRGTTLLLCKDGRLWTWGKRLDTGQPSAARLKFETWVAPAVKRFPSLGFLINSKTEIDRSPRLLWKLPPEVRRALGSGQKGVTNNSTAAHPADASHE